MVSSKFMYGKEPPEWLLTKPILSLLETKNKYLAYRKIVQSYSREETKILEDFRHGLFLSSRKLIDRIKSKYLAENLMLKYLKNGKY